MRFTGLSQQYLVVNGVLPCDQVALKPFNLVGLDALHQLLLDTVPQLAAHEEQPMTLAAASLSALVDGIATDGHGL